jgi:hypothetical protein
MVDGFYYSAKDTVHLFSFFVLSYYVSLSSEFRIVMFVTISALKGCAVHLYLRLFVGGIMPFLRYLCLLVYGGVQHVLCCVFLWFCLSSSSILHVSSFS